MDARTRSIQTRAERLIGLTENAKNCGEISRVCPECEGYGGFACWHGLSEFWPLMDWSVCPLCDGNGTIPKNEEDEE